ncbi:hypothetical protein NKDENANG_02929 [Candidatus Entotheonellaceae bacterium PAL068K]
MIELMRILHVLAAVLLLGNLMMAPFWRQRLAASGDLQARAVANRSVRLADLCFTLPGWVVLLITGLIVAIARGWFRGDRSGWLHTSLTLFVVWLVIWHVGTLRARKAMLASSDAAAAGEQDTGALERYEQQWTQWSYVSAGVALLMLILMVLRPF